MSETRKVIGDDEDAFTGIRSPMHRRHTLGGNSSLASASDHAPVVWRAVMPTGRRSSLLSLSEDSDKLRSTIDGSMRPNRSISDATSLSHHLEDKSTFALHNVDAYSVQRAKVIRRISEDRYMRFLQFFKTYEPGMASEIQTRSVFSRENLDAWVNYIVSPKVLRCIARSSDTQQELLDLLMVSTAISKYGESQLTAKVKKKAVPKIKLHTYDEYSPNPQLKERSEELVSMDFVVRINERLTEEKRVGGLILREILAHASTMQVDTQKKLSKENNGINQVVLRVQSEWFQDAMLKANGRHLYDAIRQILTNVDGVMWDAAKDKLEMKRVSIAKNQQTGAPIKQIERKSVSDHRLRRESIPPRPEASTRNATTTTEVPMIPIPMTSSTKVVFRTTNRSSSMPAEGVQEREDIVTVETERLRRKLLPLGSAPPIPRPRALPPKRPQHKANDPIIHAPSAFIIKAPEED